MATSRETDPLIYQIPLDLRSQLREQHPDVAQVAYDIGKKALLGHPAPFRDETISPLIDEVAAHLNQGNLGLTPAESMVAYSEIAFAAEWAESQQGYLQAA